MSKGVRQLKGFLWKVLCHVMFWTGVGPLLAWSFRRGHRSCWTILTYHRIGEPEDDGGPDLVSPAYFRQQLRYLRRRYEVVTVGQALERIRAGGRAARPLLSITFDDGYRDNVSGALPLLVAEDCPCTLFITVEAARDRLPPWPHRLTHDLTLLQENPPRLDGERRAALHALLDEFLRQSADPRHEGRNLIRRTVAIAKSLPAGEASRLCDEASSFTGGAGSRAADMMNVEELLQWHRAGMEVGSHTTNHHILARLPGQARRDDLSSSKRWLEEVLQTEVDLLAYPNGRADDWDEGVISDARTAGFRSAVTTIEGINRPGDDPFRLKRISVGDDSLPVFATRVSGLFGRMRAWLHRRIDRAPKPVTARLAAPTQAPAGGTGRPLTIAFIGGRGVGASYSGIERYYEEIGCRLAARGHKVIAYCRSSFSPGVKSYRGIELRHLPTIKTKHLETLIHSMLATVDVCFRRVGIVQFHALGSSPLAWIPRLTGKRSVVSVRGLDWQRAKWGRFARACLRACEWTSIYCPNATVVVSRTLKRYFDSRFKRQSRFIPNGVSRLEERPADAIRRWGLGHRGYFFYAGRISPEKGLEDLLQAHRSLDPEQPLVIAGGSSYSDQYIRRLKESADGKVIFTGFVEGDLLAELYSNALAFVLPSEMEGLSVALLEALTYGLPAIVSDIPENRELVDEFGGYVFRVNDVNSLADALRRVAADKEGALRIGRAAQAGVRARLSWDAITDETERFYLALTGR